MIALVLAGGDVHPHGRWIQRLKQVSMVIAADGGLRHAAQLGVAPDLLVGDLDSVSADERDAWPTLPTEIHPMDKDALDLELALDAAIERGATEVWIAGAFGGRIDQTLAAAWIADRYRAKGTRIALLDGLSEVYPLRRGDCWSDDLPLGTTFSLLAVSDAATVDVDGAEYPLSHHQLMRGLGLGLSNTATGPLKVHVVEGSILLVIIWESE